MFTLQIDNDGVLLITKDKLPRKHHKILFYGSYQDCIDVKRDYIHGEV